MDPVSIFGAVSAVVSTVRFLYKLVQQILSENDINETSEVIQYLVRELTDTGTYLQLFIQASEEASEEISKLRKKCGELEGSSDQSSTTRNGLILPVEKLGACLKEVQEQMPKLVERAKERKRKGKLWSSILKSEAGKDKKVAEKLRVDLKYYRENLQQVLSVYAYQDIAIMKKTINEFEKRSGGLMSRGFSKIKRLAKKFWNKIEKMWRHFSRRVLNYSANNASYRL